MLRTPLRNSSSVESIKLFRDGDFHEKVTEILSDVSKSVYMTPDEVAVASNLCE